MTPSPGSPHADFVWLDGERLIRFGPGVVDQASALLGQRGFSGFALLTTQRAEAGAPALAAAAAATLHVPPGPVPEAAAEVRDRVDGRPLVALGGGRVIDSAKAIAGADDLRCAAVPTTLSGAEMTPFHRMPAGVERFRFVRPELVLAEPGTMASQPPARLAASAMNALAHAMEALYTPLANPVAELAALRSAELLAGALGPDLGDRERAEIALAATLAGYASGLAGLAVHHAVCQTLVRATGSPHAETNAVMLPRFATMMASRAPRQMSALARALGAADGDPASAGPRIAELSRLSGHTTLSDVGVERGELPRVVAEALAHPAVQNAPDAPGADELSRLLEEAL